MQSWRRKMSQPALVSGMLPMDETLKPRRTSSRNVSQECSREILCKRSPEGELPICKEQSARTRHSIHTHIYIYIYTYACIYIYVPGPRYLNEEETRLARWNFNLFRAPCQGVNMVSRSIYRTCSLHSGISPCFIHTNFSPFLVSCRTCFLSFVHR